MAVITLAGNTIGCCIGTGSFESVGSAFSSAKQSVKSLAQGISTLKSKIDIARVAANVDTSHTQAQNAEKREETKQGALSRGYDKLENLISDVGTVDNKAADKIRERKNDFYAQYSYLKPECEKSTKEKRKEFWQGVGNAIGGFFKDAWEWCKEHWKEILATLVIVVGAVLAIVAVVATGGLALVPMLTSLITAGGALFGVTIATSTAIAIATAISVTVAVVAVGSTLASSTMNIIDTWCDMSDNVTFKKWQKGLNITSAISNGLYSIGNLYNSIKGVSGKEFIARNKAIENGKMGYSNLDANHPKMKHKPGAEYDSKRKTDILNENRARNNGQLRSDKTGKLLEQPQKSARGVKPPNNEAQVDHIIPKSQGGANSFDNAQVIERVVNRAKSNSLNFTELDYFKYSIPDKPNIGGIIFSGFNGIDSIVSGILTTTKGD